MAALASHRDRDSRQWKPSIGGSGCEASGCRLIKRRRAKGCASSEALKASYVARLEGSICESDTKEIGKPPPSEGLFIGSAGGGPRRAKPTKDRIAIGAPALRLACQDWLGEQHSPVRQPLAHSSATISAGTLSGAAPLWRAIGAGSANCELINRRRRRRRRANVARQGYPFGRLTLDWPLSSRSNGRA